MKILNWVLLLLLFLSVSCTDNGSIVANLRRVERVMETDSDSALRILQSIDRLKINDRATLARYALRYSQVLDKNYVDVDDDSLAHFAVDYYDVYGPAVERAQSAYYLGRIYENANDEERASEMFIKAEAYSRELRDKEPYLFGLSCCRLGHRYSMQYGNEEALCYYREAESVFRAIGVPINVASSNYYQAYIYRRMNMMDSAKVCTNEAIEYYKQAGMNVLAQVIEASQFASSSLIKRQIIESLNAENIDDHVVTANSYAGLARIYANEGNVDSVRYCAMQVLERFGQELPWKIWAYEVLANIETVAGNRSGEIDNAAIAQQLRDSLGEIRRFSVIRILNQQRLAQQSMKAFETLQLRNKYSRIIAVVGFLLAGGITWVLIRRTRLWRHKMHKQLRLILRERREHNDLTQRMKSEYDNLDKQYKRLLRESQRVMPSEQEQLFSDTIESRMKGIRSMVSAAYNFKVKPTALLDAFKSVVMASPNAKLDRWSDLQYVVNKKYKGVVDYLHEHHPGLGPHDMDLCCMICFEFSAPGICFIYGYDDMGSLYNKRSRLRRKLNLLDAHTLETYLRRLCRKMRIDAANDDNCVDDTFDDLFTDLSDEPMAGDLGEFTCVNYDVISSDISDNLDETLDVISGENSEIREESDSEAQFSPQDNASA